ncbi:MAG: hypothetical protein ABI388_01025 [Bacteroidia bacterium]
MNSGTATGMRKLSKDILARIEEYGIVFKYPASKKIIKDVFYINIEEDFKKYDFITKDKEGVNLSLCEDSNKIEKIKEITLLDGTWWVYP